MNQTKPSTSAGYLPDQLALVTKACLYLATKLGDLRNDVVVVGGLVPGLLIDQTRLAEGTEPHVGTQDLDLGLTVALLTERRYVELTRRLRQAGLERDVNEHGNPTRQRWVHVDHDITIDFLISPSLEGDRPGAIRNIESDFGAVITPGLPLAFRDQLEITLSGTTLHGEKATREINVCGPGAYVALKALAFDSRGENKDAYDLHYVLRNYGAGPRSVAAAFRPLLDDAHATRALAILRRDFLDPDGVGPIRVSAFMGADGGSDPLLRNDVVGFVSEFLGALPPP